MIEILRFKFSYCVIVLSASACPQAGNADLWNDVKNAPGNVVNTAKKAADDTANAAKKAANDAANTGKKAVDDTANTGKKAIGDAASTAHKAIGDTGNAFDKGVKDVSRTVEKAGDDTYTTIKKANNDTVKTLQTAAGDSISTLEKSGSDAVTTVYKAANDTTATYVKGWKDTGAQAKRSFEDAVQAGQATARYTQREMEAQRDAVSNAQKRLRQGKVIDAMWGLAIEPQQATEKNFFKATQESSVINAAAAAAAATYGGPAGAAAYAAWSTYRATGDANLALRAGVLSAIASEAGGAVSNMPSSTAAELLKKAAVTGAIGGLTVAAAGGSQQDIQNAFLKSGSAVLVQGASDRLNAYSPHAQDAIKTVQCISAKDLDCLSDTTYAKDLKGKILYDANGNPRIDPRKLDPAQYVGQWTGIDPNSIEGKKSKFLTDISKLPNAQAIPILDKQWVVTWTMGQAKTFSHNAPQVVLTYVGPNAPFYSTVKYGRDVAAATTAHAIATGPAPSNMTYICPVNGFNRKVTVRSTQSSCEAVYSKEHGATQVIWKSDHENNICAPHADNFIRSLQGMKIGCTRG